MTDRVDRDDVVLEPPNDATEYHRRPTPPPSPLADDPPDPRVLTAAERRAVEAVRHRYPWYHQHDHPGRAQSDVTLLLRLLDRLAGPTTPPADDDADAVARERAAGYRHTSPGHSDEVYP